MNVLKRNQVEEAISRTQGERSAVPSEGLRTRLKRLLDTDRALTLKARKAGSNVVNYAFRTDSPGKGTDVSFSGYEAFALQTGLRFLEHGWPQSFVVQALRHIRADFEQHYSDIMKQDPSKLFDKAEIKKLARSDDIEMDNANPVFLTVVSSKVRFEDGISDQTSVEIRRGMTGVSKLLKQKKAQSWTLFELATYAHRLGEQLAAAQPRNRGRS